MHIARNTKPASQIQGAPASVIASVVDRILMTQILTYLRFIIARLLCVRKYIGSPRYMHLQPPCPLYDVGILVVLKSNQKAAGVATPLNERIVPGIKQSGADELIEVGWLGAGFDVST
ncbi:MAG: hypothetical protein H6822_30375 [Planctomycetaceae bacterium]|nr:hypothetical protein [Planctomycetales bacterium]MCB9926490.1 hypothetical protein [Planctomycetaceae bacterium]